MQRKSCREYLIWILISGFVILFNAGSAQSVPTQNDSSADGVESSPPAEVRQGNLVIQLDGNRDFCVTWNEVKFDPDAIRPREKRYGPLITTFGYKYQISAIRRGTTGVAKLFESPVIRTAYWKKQPPPQAPPTPRVATEKELRKNVNPFEVRKLVVWIPEQACTKLSRENSFSLVPGRYDFYIGFDVLVLNGQWSPLINDFITDVVIEADMKTTVHGVVDYSDGVRTVKLESFEIPQPVSDR